MISLVCLILALAFFIMSAMNPGSPVWNRYVAAGLAFLTASFLRWPIGG